MQRVCACTCTYAYAYLYTDIHTCTCAYTCSALIGCVVCLSRLRTDSGRKGLIMANLWLTTGSVLILGPQRVSTFMTGSPRPCPLQIDLPSSNSLHPFHRSVSFPRALRPPRQPSSQNILER